MGARPAGTGTATERPLRFMTGVDVALRRRITVEDNQSQFSRYHNRSASSIPYSAHLLPSFSYTSYSYFIHIPHTSPQIQNLSKMSTTATCYCGAVKPAFSVEGDNLVDTVSTPFHPVSSTPILTPPVQFICHCTDDRKITSTIFALNFIVKNDTLKYVHGVKQQEGNHYC